MKHGTCPIFVTYNKDKEISYTIQYQDEFINRHQFSWMTKNNRTKLHKEIQPVLRQEEFGTDIHLFVKKGDDEGTAHYYLGRVKTLEARDTNISDKKDTTKTKPIVNIKFAMQDPVREDIYDYLVD